MSNKTQNYLTPRSNFSYVKYTEFFNPLPPPNRAQDQERPQSLLEKLEKLVKPEKQATGISYFGIHGMLVKIAHRDYCKKWNRQPSNWSCKVQGASDNKTANLIDKKMNGKLKALWYEPTASGDMLVNLLFQTYPDYKYLEAEWQELKRREF